MPEFTNSLHKFLTNVFGPDRVVYDVKQSHIEVSPYKGKYQQSELRKLGAYCKVYGGTFFVTYDEEMVLIIHPVKF